MNMIKTDSGKKTIMYIHGFLSSAKGGTARNLISRYSYIYNVVCPEVDADPISSLDRINQLIEETNPMIIIGTSLGGFYALSCNNRGCKVIVVNPCIYPSEALKSSVGLDLTYYSEREDGQQRYALTEEVLGKFKDISLADRIESNRPNIFAICSSNDELLGDSHIKFLTPLLEKNFVYVMNCHSHRADKEITGLLYEAIENAAETIRECETANCGQ